MDSSPDRLLNSPESITDMPWSIKKGFESQAQELAVFIRRKGFAWPDNKALQGGRILEPETESDADRKALSGRPMVVIPLKEKPEDQEYSFVLHKPSEVKGGNEPNFAPNLWAYRTIVAAYVKKKWIEAGHKGKSPIPIAIQIFETDQGHAFITGYRKNLRSLGAGGPEKGIHLANPHEYPDSPEGMRILFDYLEAAHPTTNEFAEWENVNQIDIPNSWLKEGNEGCNFRGGEWWYNRERDFDEFKSSDKRWGDRLEELTDKMTDNPEVKVLYDELAESIKGGDPEFSFTEALEEMIKNNLPLYRFKNGKTELNVGEHLIEKDENLLAATRVTHGTLFPRNIHKSRNPQSGETEYTLTSGDRAQRKGLSGQIYDASIAGLALDRKRQQLVTDEFLRRHPEEKERRGLAMHTLYRSIMETKWFVENGEKEAASNLIKLTADILRGKGAEWNGVWDGVNKPMYN